MEFLFRLWYSIIYIKNAKIRVNVEVDNLDKHVQMQEMEASPFHRKALRISFYPRAHFRPNTQKRYVCCVPLQLL